MHACVFFYTGYCQGAFTITVHWVVRPVKPKICIGLELIKIKLHRDVARAKENM